MNAPYNRFDVARRAPKSRWTGTLRTAPMISFVARCEVCGPEVTVINHHCSKCSRHVVEPEKT